MLMAWGLLHPTPFFSGLHKLRNLWHSCSEEGVSCEFSTLDIESGDFTG